jgi:hypothetical protein
MNAGLAERASLRVVARGVVLLVGWSAWAATASVARRSDLLDYKYGQNKKCFKKP